MRETEIKVKLIDWTGAGHIDPNYAARLLAFTKSTRLSMDPGSLDRFMNMPVDELMAEIQYMVRTLPSSWEFVNATFAVMDVSRACAQQITRTRWSPMEGDIFGSYAMQAQRVVDVRGVGGYVPEAVKKMDMGHWFLDRMDLHMHDYATALASGIHNEDARGLLPMHVASNLVVQYNLRALTDICRKRRSMRVQGEYNTVVRLMREAVEAIWPWSAPFFEPKETIASGVIEEAAHDIDRLTLPEGIKRALKMKLAKAADLLIVG